MEFLCSCTKKATFEKNEAFGVCRRVGFYNGQSRRMAAFFGEKMKKRIRIESASVNESQFELTNMNEVLAFF